MKKNVLQLLGIAFVVAIAATGIFYGLLAGKLRESGAAATQTLLIAVTDLSPGTVLSEKNVQLGAWAGAQAPPGAFSEAQKAMGMTVTAFIYAGEPVTAQRVASADNGSGSALGVRSGMRAVSVHVSEPAGVVGMLRGGHRVDVQVILTRGPAGEPAVKTILQNVEVLDNSHAQGTPRGTPVITLLASPADADVLALADSAASVRLLLRSPLDTARARSAALSMPALFRESATERPAVVEVATRTTPDKNLIRLHVQIAAMSLRGGGTVSAQTLESGRQPEPGLEVLAESDHQISSRHIANIRKASAGYVLRIQLAPAVNDRGKLRLRVGSETIHPENGGYATRRHDIEAELSGGQKLLVSGLAQLAGDALLDRLFPGKIGKRDLVVLIAPEWSQTVALGKSR